MQNEISKNGHPQTDSTTQNTKLSKAEVARINGSLSKGPTSAQGKRNSSRNALKHGLTAKNALPANQNPSFFDEIRANLVCEFSPSTQAEIQCIDRLSLASARFTSAVIEANALIENKRLAMAAAGQTGPDISEQLRNALALEALNKESTTYDNYLRYQRDFDRQYSRALRDLLLLRKHLPASTGSDAFTRHAQPQPPSDLPTHPLEPSLDHTDNQPFPAQANEPDSQPATPSTNPELSNPSSQPNAPETLQQRNEPTDLPETKQSPPGAEPATTPSATPAVTDIYDAAAPTSFAPAAPDTQSEPAHRKTAYRSEWETLVLTQKALRKHPDAYQTVLEALREAPELTQFLDPPPTKP